MKKCLLPKLLLLIVFYLVTIKSYSQNYTQASNWTIQYPASSTMVENVVDKFDGTKSAKVTWTSNAFDHIIDSDPIAVIGNASYSFSFNCLDVLEWDGQVYAYLSFNDPDETFAVTSESVNLSFWQTFGISGTVPATATSVYISFRFAANVGFGSETTISIDNAIYTENGGPNLVTNSSFETWELVDPDPPVWTALYPKIDNITTSTFDLTVNTNEEGAAYYVVLADGSIAPTSTEIKAGTGNNGDATVVSGSISIPNLSTDYTKTVLGLISSTDYDVYIISEDDEINPNLNDPVLIKISTESALAEPLNHVTLFTTVANSIYSIKLTWTDAIGDQAPESYLIKASTGTITAPEDGTDPTEDTDLTDGSAIIKVLHGGAQEYTFTGLSPATNYNFQIWSYTNNGSVIDFKKDGTVPASSTSTVSSELFFSEYIEGSTGNTALEIYNPKSNSVNLSNYKLLGSSDGGGWDSNSSVVLPNITLAPGGTYVICRADANQDILDEANLTFSDGPTYEMSFSGNDARALAITTDGGTTWSIIDIIGEKDVNPGTAWNVAGNTTATADHTLIRKTGRTYGNDDWASSTGTTNGNSEWIVMSQDYFNNLGAYRVINTDATLSALTYNETSITNFSSIVYTYNQELDFDASLPTVAAIANDATYATININQVQNLTGTVAERTATVTVTADDLSTIDYTIIFTLGTELNSDATVTSTEYIVENVAETITGIPYGTTLDEFKSNLTPATAASFNVFETDGITEASEIITGYKLIVTAEDATTKIYTITVIDANTEATITSMEYTINHASLTISDIPTGTSLEIFESNITPATGATIETYKTDGITITTDLATDYKLIVTAEDGTTTKTYTITILTGTNSIINNLDIKLYPNPSNGLFKLELFNTANEEFFVEIYDVIGKIVYSSKIKKNISIIDLSEINKGIYYVSIKKENNRKVTKIVIH
ncbi:MAG: T9SS type A sorting domain-containing protein [Bacteroidales bacterium]|nr:T9SS type A sorting domain-containing protein [Bacteroidales bacterium]